MANVSIWIGKRRSRTQDYTPILLWKSDRFDGLSSDDDVRSSALFRRCLNLGYFNFYFNTFYVWTQS